MTVTAEALAAFTLACLADPEDEGPRLICADYMEENDFRSPFGMPLWPVLRRDGYWALAKGPDGQQLYWVARGKQDDALVYLGDIKPISCMCTTGTPIHCPDLATRRSQGEWRCEQHWEPSRLDDVDWRLPETAYGLDWVRQAEVRAIRGLAGRSHADITWTGPVPVEPPERNVKWVAVMTATGDWLFPILRYYEAQGIGDPPCSTARWGLRSLCRRFYRIAADGTLSRW